MGDVVVYEDGLVFKGNDSRWVGRRCEATSKQTGNRCRRFTGHPSLGVCRFHGGASKLVRAAANRRVSALLPQAISTLQEIMTSSPNEFARLRAARMAMQYSGITPRNVHTESRTQRTMKAIGRGSENSSDNEIERLIKELTHGEAPGLESGEVEAT